MNVEIRRGSPEELDAVCALESGCFSSAEADPREVLQERLRIFPQYFRILREDGVPAAYIGGMLTNAPDLEDVMYKDASLHDPEGRWMMIFTVCTAAEFRGRGYAARLMKMLIQELREEGRSGMVLCCHDHLADFYRQFGFINEGRSSSRHGGEKNWLQMRLIL